ncbi:TadE-like protein [Friedmanniella luteola]|uniref:TadE-like protein n=1 Tax=Friedmanniella luteola TaxID=546871 RepID=A0A1H1X9H1_9ACTN|nr:TadE family protein [Friedmanniella luteola]SDT05978.1 TadE-like protein [Friedmanniella luteola]
MTVSGGERGAAAVEFALVVPLLVLLVLGIAEFGRAYYLQTTLSGAAREGVRVMALRNDTGQARTAVRNAASPLVLSDAQIDVTPGSGTCLSTATSSPNATVTIRYTMTFATQLIGTTLDLQGKGVMRCGG